MSDKNTSQPAGQVPPKTGDIAEEILGGDNPRGEVAGCPTGLSRPSQDPAAEEACAHGHEYKPKVEELKGSPITGRAR